MRRTEAWIRRYGALVRDAPGLGLQLLFFPIGAGITYAAFFLPAVPFALALLPLVAGLWSGARAARFTTMTSFMIWPVFLSAWGLYGLDVRAPELVWSLAAAFVILFGLLAGQIGILPTTLLLTLIPVFPASPLLPLATLLPGLGLPGLFGTLTGLALIEATRKVQWRRNLLMVLIACLGAWATGHALIRENPAQHPRSDWREIPAPVAVTERGRWLAIREQMPDSATVVLGENVFAAKDSEARAFWCHAATSRNLILYLGVAEPYGDVTRGAVWRLDTKTCAKPPIALTEPVIHHAALGIPHLTGTWGPMRSTPTLPQGSGEDTDWLICLEAFLPWAWGAVLTDTESRRRTPRPVIVLSNDTAFRPLPDLPPLPPPGTPPVHELRRKAAIAMAGLAGRNVLFAETGRTILMRSPERNAP
ncbi:hypothetical protein [Ruegeria atlantica]|uniref:hypothetical protein n=1 Tax=Ruegeria atlantica TaxID=81569 RepID=UPI00147FC9E1|nr:hypothetical protein [Ruegeria atlantica]